VDDPDADVLELNDLDVLDAPELFGVVACWEEFWFALVGVISSVFEDEGAPPDDDPEVELDDLPFVALAVPSLLPLTFDFLDTGEDAEDCGKFPEDGAFLPSPFTLASGWSRLIDGIGPDLLPVGVVEPLSEEFIGGGNIGPGRP
jgi:hypothetical protein